MLQPLIRKFKHACRRILTYLDLQETASRITFVKEYLSFKKLMIQGGEQRFSLTWRDRLVCLSDKTVSTGFDRHYIYHLAWAARVLAQTRPPFHVDISSSLYFCSVVSAFVPVRFYDYRPTELRLSNLTEEFADLLTLPFANQSLKSLSCMHVVEHVGLGRYGDTLDPDGDLKAMAELKRVLAPNGSLLFVVPIGQPRIMFNGHRIYSYEQIIRYFDKLKLQEFALIPDSPADGGLVYNPSKEMPDAQTYGCGCFWFIK
jgi:SAM-dependent methyltransferase